MDEMGTQKPLAVNSSILNKHIPTKSPSKRPRARKTLDRCDVRHKDRVRHKSKAEELDFLDAMDTTCDTFPQMQHFPGHELPYHDHDHNMVRNTDISFHSLPPEYDEIRFPFTLQQRQQQQQQQLLLQPGNYYLSSPTNQQIQPPQLPPRPDFNTSMLVFNSSGFKASSPHSHSPVPIMPGFPSYFNPRQAKNMPHSEKVERWMENLPINYEECGQITTTDCFSISEDSEDWEEDEFDNDLEESIVLTSSVEIIFLQQRRLTALTKKLYKMST